MSGGVYPRRPCRRARPGGSHFYRKDAKNAKERSDDALIPLRATFCQLSVSFPSTFCQLSVSFPSTFCQLSFKGVCVVVAPIFTSLCRLRLYDVEIGARPLFSSALEEVSSAPAWEPVRARPRCSAERER